MSADELRELIARQKAAAQNGAEGSAIVLAFRWAEDLVANTPDRPDFIHDGYFAKGWVTLFAAGPKVGKSTYLTALIRARAESRDSFVGRWLKPGKTVLVTEEPESMVRPKLVGMPEKRVRILSRGDAPNPRPSWGEFVRLALADAKEIGADFIIIDTVAHWAGLGHDSEKDAGAVTEVMHELQHASAEDVAICVVHHNRKTPGEYGEAVRGSNAWVAEADCAITVERVGEPGSKQRMLKAESRWPETPDALVVEFDGAHGFALISEGEREEQRVRASVSSVLAALPSAPPGLKIADIAGEIGLSRPQVSKLLNRAAERGWAESALTASGGAKTWWRVFANTHEHPRTPPLPTETGSAPRGVFAPCIEANTPGTPSGGPAVFVNQDEHPSPEEEERLERIAGFDPPSAASFDLPVHPPGDAQSDAPSDASDGAS